MKCGTLATPQSVSMPVPGSWAAVSPRVSIGTPVWRCTAKRSTSRRSDAASPLSALPARAERRSMMLPPAAGCSTGMPGSLARRASATTGKRLPVDLDQLRRVLGEIAAGRDHEGDRLADIADQSGGERRLQAGVGADAGALAEPHGNPADRAEIVGGDHGRDAGERARRAGADGRDPRVRMRRPQHGRVEQSRQADVGGVLPAPGQEPEILLALDRQADHRASRRKSRAAVPPRIAASSPAARRASRTTRQGSGSPIQKG